ncbi:hypothetical protein DL96DRAFT_1630958 [Flagelloscypha sp. PMI_526]|nr:hypothetical protein DL96DRAFT_1630958 [Flagelloscypha sp. PMI_526]
MDFSQAFIEHSADYAFYSFVATMISSLFYGIFLGLAILSLGILRKRSQESSCSLPILYWAIIWSLHGTAGLIFMVKRHQLVSSDLHLEERMAAITNSEIKPLAAAMILQPLSFIVADAVSIWRAYILWPHSKSGCISQAVIGPYLLFHETPRSKSLITTLSAIQRHKSFIREHRLQQSFLLSGGLHILLLLVEIGVLLSFAQALNIGLAVASGLALTKTASDPLSLTHLLIKSFGETVSVCVSTIQSLFLFFSAGHGNTSFVFY